ncbi:EthD family reductase [Actinosynnema sp. NPDC020468]|uniref:EthD family reductase n=1 Tax=Actinosynnema sp. NPDC020468 TaxID=3154488 RepID=UPI003411E395
MIKYVALYRKPDDVEAFDTAYFESHLPIVAKTPGLIRAEVSRATDVFVPGFFGEHEPHLVAEMYFADATAMKRAFASPEWQAAGVNLTEIGGMDLVAMFAAEVVVG